MRLVSCICVSNTNWFFNDFFSFHSIFRRIDNSPSKESQSNLKYILHFSTNPNSPTIFQILTVISIAILQIKNNSRMYYVFFDIEWIFILTINFEKLSIIQTNRKYPRLAITLLLLIRHNYSNKNTQTDWKKGIK